MTGMDVELIVDAGLDPLEDQPIGALDLAVGLRVVHRCLVHSNSLGVIEVQEFVTCELSVVISDNMIWNLEPMDDVLDELSHSL